MWVSEFGTWLASLGARDDGLGRGLAIWERGPLARWWLRVVFARAAGGLEWYLRAISGLRAFAGRRPALLVVRHGLAVWGCGWRAWERGPLARKQSCK